jgi:hypothetical protein
MNATQRRSGDCYTVQRTLVMSQFSGRGSQHLANVTKVVFKLAKFFSFLHICSLRNHQTLAAQLFFIESRPPQKNPEEVYRPVPATISRADVDTNTQRHSLPQKPHSGE